MFTSRAVRGSRGHVLIGTWPAARAGGSTLYVVGDDGWPARYRGVIRAANVPLLLYSRLAARFSVETADGVIAMAVVTFGALVALGRPFPLISLIDTLGYSALSLRAREFSSRDRSSRSRFSISAHVDDRESSG